MSLLGKVTLTLKEAVELYAKYPPGAGCTCTAEYERFAEAREMLATEYLELRSKLIAVAEELK